VLKPLILLILFFSNLAVAESKKELRPYLLEQFSPKISQALQAKTKTEIEKIMGSPTMSEKSAIYYEVEGFKYALSAEINNGKITKIFYHPKSVKLSLKDFDENRVIDKSKIRPVKKNGVDDGLFSEYIDKDSHLRLVFRNASGLSLSTVEVLK